MHYTKIIYLSSRSLRSDWRQNDVQNCLIGLAVTWRCVIPLVFMQQDMYDVYTQNTTIFSMRSIIGIQIR